MIIVVILEVSPRTLYDIWNVRDTNDEGYVSFVVFTVLYSCVITEYNVKQRLPLMEQELLTFQKPLVYPSCSGSCCLICRICATIVCPFALF